MDAHEPPDDLVPLSQAATLLHAHRNTVWRWVLSGKLRAWRPGGKYLVSLADVRQLLRPAHARTRDVSAGGEEARQAESRQEKEKEVLARWGL